MDFDTSGLRVKFEHRLTVYIAIHQHCHQPLITHHVTSRGYRSQAPTEPERFCSTNVENILLPVPSHSTGDVVVQNALSAMVEAMPAASWTAELPALASRIGGGEPEATSSLVAGVSMATSHKRRLAAIRTLPCKSPRSRQLRLHALVHLLKSLMRPASSNSAQVGLLPGARPLKIMKGPCI